MQEPGNITVLLQRADQGDAQAKDELYRLVESELKAIAANRKRLAPDTLQTTTGLVDDVFCRLVGRNNVQWQPGDKRKFFAYVSVKIHDLIVDEVRKANAVRHGGAFARVVFEERDGRTHVESAERAVELLSDLQSALQRFEQLAKDDAEVFRQRYYLDSTFAEIAERMGKTEKWVQRSFRRARTYLQEALKDYADES